jgi:hypothetical protein
VLPHPRGRGPCRTSRRGITSRRRGEYVGPGDGREATRGGLFMMESGGGGGRSGGR